MLKYKSNHKNTEKSSAGLSYFAQITAHLNDEEESDEDDDGQVSFRQTRTTIDNKDLYAYIHFFIDENAEI